MDELEEALKKAQADSFAFYLKAHYFHWNIEGANFPQYHSFLNDLYEEVFAAVDTIAEVIRTLDVYVPGSFTRFKELTSIQDETTIPSAMSMITRLKDDNEKVLDTLTKAYELAEQAKKYGISNLIQDRIQAHEKHAWMLRSIIKA
jgi:starvation-inducible DNA-binding protein